VNTKTIVKLADRNNATLAKYSEAWAKHFKCENPVATVMDSRRFNRFLQIGPYLLFLVALFGQDAEGGACWLLTAIPLGLTTMLFFLGLVQWRNEKQVRLFCEAMSLLEGKIGGLTWCSVDWVNDIWVRNQAEAIVANHAAEVKKLQQVPWRKKESEKLRALTEKVLVSMVALTGAKEDRGFYYNKA
jgi:hypothetical protein